MPKQFEWCIKQKGSRIRTRKLSEGRYQRICIKDGKTYAGEIKVKKSHQKSHQKTYSEATRT